MSQVQKLLSTLPKPQQQAVQIVKISLDCFNSRDGEGMFSGVSRYNVLAQRLPLAAVQARDIYGFWSNLLRKMQWPLPPKRMDKEIVSVLAVDDDQKTLKAIATETVSIITLARMLHDEDKAKRKDYFKELYASSDCSSEGFDDSLEGI